MYSSSLNWIGELMAHFVLKKTQSVWSAVWPPRGTWQWVKNGLKIYKCLGEQSWSTRTDLCVMSITMEKDARCFAVRETTPSATSRVENAGRSSVIPDGKDNTAQSVRIIPESTNYSRDNTTVTIPQRLIHDILIKSRMKLFTSMRKCSLYHVFKWIKTEPLDK